MKTLTEFSTLTLRKAAEVRARVGGSVRQAPAPEAHAPPPAPRPPPPAEGEASVDGTAEAQAAAESSATEADEAPDPVVEAVATELQLQPDRAARLLEALDIVGDRIDQVRLVRVFQGETAPHGAVSRGEFHYAVDRVVGPPKRRGSRDDRGDRRGGDRGDRRRGGGGGERRDKPRGLGSLKAGAKEEPKPDDRPGRGEMPRAGIGWQLTAAPRDLEGRRGGGGRGDRRERRGRGPGGPGGPRGPGGPGGPRGPNPRGPGGPGGPGGFGAGGPGGGGSGGGDSGDRRDRRDRGPRREQRMGPPPPAVEGDVTTQQPPHVGAEQAQGPAEPRPAGEGGRKRRPRKPIGPDANGLGPDGTPWDPERRAKRQAEREAARTATVNTAEAPSVETVTPPSTDASEAPQNSE